MNPRSPFLITVTLAPLALGGFFACSTASNPYTREDLPIDRVAVAPFFIVPEKLHNTASVLGGQRVVRGDASFWLSAEVGDEFRHEMTRFTGFTELVGPQAVFNVLDANPELTLSTPEDLKTIGRLLEVDAIAIGAVTDFESQLSQPRVGLWFQLHYVPSMRRESELWFLDAARGLGLPPGLESFGGMPPVFGMFATYDYAAKDTVSLVARYAKLHDQGDRYLTPAEQIVQEPYPRFFRCLFWDTLNRMIEQEERRQSEVPFDG